MIEEFEPACRRMEWLDPFYKKVWETAFQKGIPISGTFELTPRCNFNCRMCYVRLGEKEIPKRGKELSADKWIDIASEAKAAGMIWLCITGGEPLLHPEFPRIWKQLSLMGFFLTLQTNGSLINEDIIKLFKAYPPRQVKITLYGTDDLIYQDVCRVKNGFTRVNDGIHTLMSMGIPVILVSTVLKQNINDVKNMAYYAYCHHLSWSSTIDIKSSCRNEKNDAEFFRLKEIQEESRKQEIKKRIQEKKWINPKQKPCTYCKDYRLGFWIFWDGTMNFCSFLNNSNISIKKMTFLDAWKQLLKFEDNLKWPKNCSSCQAAKVCMKCFAMLDMEEGKVKSVRGVSCNTIRKWYQKYNV